jgi:hypothetical protein
MPLADAVLIHSYTRAHAIRDGGLIDVTTHAKDAGFRVPVALTAAVWGDCVAWDNHHQPVHQDESGRLWDLLTMARHALCSHVKRRGDRTTFTLLRIPRGEKRPLPVRLAMQIGPGDQGEPVVTIMQPEED